METNNCINCNSALLGTFCSNCGQKSTIERITAKTLFSNYIGRIFGFDTKFLRTVKDLTISPGKVGRTFIEGNRVRYIDPVGYFFIISTLMLLAFTLLNVDIQEFMFGNTEDFAKMSGQETPTAKQEQFQKYWFQWVSDNMRIMGFMVIPFMGIVGKILYRKSGLNLLEHTVNAFYIQGHTTVFTVCAILLFSITDINVNIYSIFVLIPYFAWATKSFYKKKGFAQLLKGVLYYSLGTILFMLFLMVFGAMVMIIYVKYINPDFLG